MPPSSPCYQVTLSPNHLATPPPHFHITTIVYSRGVLMKIHEYQAKELLAAAGANVPRGIVASSPAEAQQAFERMGGPVVLKAQIHAGGRGKGRFKDSGKDFGGVKFIKTREEVGAVAAVMF